MHCFCFCFAHMRIYQRIVQPETRPFVTDSIKNSTVQSNETMNN